MNTKKKDPDATTASIYGDMVRRMKRLKNWASYKNVGEFVHDAVREKLIREELRDSREIVEREEQGPLRSSQEKPSS